MACNSRDKAAQKPIEQPETMTIEPASPVARQQPKKLGNTEALKPSDKIIDWKGADFNHRLALCIGIATVANRGQAIQLKPMDYHNCIEEATRGLSQTDGLVIFDVAKACDALMRQ